MSPDGFEAARIARQLVERLEREAGRGSASVDSLVFLGEMRAKLVVLGFMFDAWEREVRKELGL